MPNPNLLIAPELEALARRVAELYPGCGLVVECPQTSWLGHNSDRIYGWQCLDCHGTDTVLRPMMEWLGLLVRAGNKHLSSVDMGGYWWLEDEPEMHLMWAMVTAKEGEDAQQ